MRWPLQRKCGAENLKSRCSCTWLPHCDWSSKCSSGTSSTSCTSSGLGQNSGRCAIVATQGATLKLLTNKYSGDNCPNSCTAARSTPSSSSSSRSAVPDWTHPARSTPPGNSLVRRAPKESRGGACREGASFLDPGRGATRRQRGGRRQAEEHNAGRSSAPVRTATEQRVPAKALSVATRESRAGRSSFPSSYSRELCATSRERHDRSHALSSLRSTVCRMPPLR